ncbi:hypothetical protein M407DRAFT_33509 [Tulasnella calospora MUT 4182]|uniref:Uncharacterized protein n=1 Tax=Tulasnella calospora MUT 4182 TaxID=1051891 RepID=A0A0C3PQK8_9AGAM|nr:hypothetical protein M407DRAFT_33509 [Tulasnella calospora MUT 4182]
MFNMYRNPSMASFSSDGSNFDPTLSTPSLSLTSPDSISSSFRNPASNTISSDFWGPSSSLGGAGSPTSAGGGGFGGGGGGSANDKPWSSTSIPLVPPMLTNPAAIPSMPEGPALPMKTRNGIVTIFGFSPQQGEPKTRLTVSIGFKQLPGRLIGLRIVFGSGGLRTHVGGGNKKGQWMLRAEVPDVPSATNPSSHILKIEALEGDQVIDNAEFGSFTLWEAGEFFVRAEEA